MVKGQVAGYLALTRPGVPQDRNRGPHCICTLTCSDVEIETSFEHHHIHPRTEWINVDGMRCPRVVYHYKPLSETYCVRRRAHNPQWLS